MSNRLAYNTQAHDYTKQYAQIYLNNAENPQVGIISLPNSSVMMQMLNHFRHVDFSIGKPSVASKNTSENIPSSSNIYNEHIPTNIKEELTKGESSF